MVLLSFPRYQRCTTLQTTTLTSQSTSLKPTLRPRRRRHRRRHRRRPPQRRRHRHHCSCTYRSRMCIHLTNGHQIGNAKSFLRCQYIVDSSFFLLNSFLNAFYQQHISPPPLTCKWSRLLLACCVPHPPPSLYTTTSLLCSCGACMCVAHALKTYMLCCAVLC